MTRFKSALSVVLLTIAAGASAAAEQGTAVPGLAASDACTACFAYLEFPDSLEPESYATRGDSPTSLPAAGEGKGRPSEPAADTISGSEQQPRTSGSLPGKGSAP